MIACLLHIIIIADRLSLRRAHRQPVPFPADHRLAFYNNRPVRGWGFVWVVFDAVYTLWT
jgi:hypothetical protein